MKRVACAFAVLLAACSLAVAADPTVEVLVGPAAKDPGPKPKPGDLNWPFGVDFETDGSMIIVEYTGGRILRRSADGKLAHIGGAGKAGYRDGPAMAAEFQDMHNIAIGADGKYYLSDHKNNAVRRMDPKAGTVDTYAGGKAGYAGDGQTADKAQFKMVMSVSIDAKQRLLVADIKNYRIRQIDLATGKVSTVAGNGKKGKPADGAKATDAPLVDPRAAAYDAHGNLYVVERGGNALRVVSLDGTIRTVAGTGKKGARDGPALEATMTGPKHLAIAPNGDVYIADDFSHAIRKYDPKAKTLTTVIGKGAWKVRRPHGVTVHKGWLYVADTDHHRVLRVKID